MPNKVNAHQQRDMPVSAGRVSLQDQAGTALGRSVRPSALSLARGPRGSIFLGSVEGCTVLSMPNRDRTGQLGTDRFRITEPAAAYN
jgi:hypothetical protein